MRSFSKYRLLYLLNLLINAHLIAQNQTKGNGIDSIMINSVFNEKISTVLLQDSTFQLSAPILQLSSKQSLVLSFDEFTTEPQIYTYTILHCNANWTQSKLSVGDYLIGPPTNFITTYQRSQNTRNPYIHYVAKIPGESMIITKSGNYIIVVYANNNPKEVLFTKRFTVVEQLITVNGTIKPPATVMERNYKQEVDFTLDCSSFPILNPYEDLLVVIHQNGREDNAISNLKPSFVKENLLTYDFDNGENVFPGGNEFRALDIKSVHTPAMMIQKIIQDSVGYAISLLPDERRPFKRYVKIDDINGRFIIKNQDGYLSDVDGEYVDVKFFLPVPEKIPDGDIYVLGALTDWQFLPKNRMSFNSQYKAYELILRLKQGYYNYEYVFLEKNQSIGDETIIEGMHVETENEYDLFVYFHDMTINYDRLIAHYYFSPIAK